MATREEAGKIILKYILMVNIFEIQIAMKQLGLHNQIFVSYILRVL
jgi:hypothetical protein